jgi:cell division septation protein DedD
MFDKLKKAGYFPYAVQKGRSLFRLYLGAYEKKSEAEALQQRLQKNGIKSQVVKR